MMIFIKDLVLRQVSNEIGVGTIISDTCRHREQAQITTDEALLQISTGLVTVVAAMEALRDITWQHNIFWMVG